MKGRKTPGRRAYDNTNVIKLVWASAETNKDTINTLRGLLVLAEQGELIGLSYAALMRRGVDIGSVGASLDQRIFIKGALMELASKI